MQTSVSISTAPVQPTSCMLEFSIVGHFPHLLFLSLSLSSLRPFFFLLLFPPFPFLVLFLSEIWSGNHTTTPTTTTTAAAKERATCGKKDETLHNGQSSLIPGQHSKCFGFSWSYEYFLLSIKPVNSDLGWEREKAHFLFNVVSRAATRPHIADSQGISGILTGNELSQPKFEPYSLITGRPVSALAVKMYSSTSFPLFSLVIILLIYSHNCQKTESLCIAEIGLNAVPSWFLLPFRNYDFWHGRKMWRRLRIE